MAKRKQEDEPTDDQEQSTPKRSKPRRGHGEGTVFQRKDGRYIARIRLEDGTRKEYYFKTQKEAIEKKNELLHEKKQGTLTTGPRQLLKDYLDYWLEEVHKPTIRLTTYIKYRKLLSSYILPVIGHIQLQKLTPLHVQNLYNRYRKTEPQKRGKNSRPRQSTRFMGSCIKPLITPFAGISLLAMCAIRLLLPGSRRKKTIP